MDTRTALVRQEISRLHSTIQGDNRLQEFPDEMIPMIITAPLSYEPGNNDRTLREVIRISDEPERSSNAIFEQLKTIARCAPYTDPLEFYTLR
jgi:hypothetical protein